MFKNGQSDTEITEVTTPTLAKNFMKNKNLCPFYGRQFAWTLTFKKLIANNKIQS